MDYPPCMAFSIYWNDTDGGGQLYCLKSSASPLTDQSKGTMRGPCEGTYVYMGRHDSSPLPPPTTTTAEAAVSSGLSVGAKAGIGAGRHIHEDSSVSREENLILVV